MKKEHVKEEQIVCVLQSVRERVIQPTEEKIAGSASEVELGRGWEFDYVARMAGIDELGLHWKWPRSGPTRAGHGARRSSWKKVGRCPRPVPGTNCGNLGGHCAAAGAAKQQRADCRRLRAAGRWINKGGTPGLCLGAHGADHRHTNALDVERPCRDNGRRSLRYESNHGPSRRVWRSRSSIYQEPVAVTNVVPQERIHMDRQGNCECVFSTCWRKLSNETDCQSRAAVSDR